LSCLLSLESGTDLGGSLGQLFFSSFHTVLWFLIIFGGTFIIHW
jgi:hypothetical protein